MVSGMSRRRTTRCLALVWAIVQLLSPGVSAIADGRLAQDNATAPVHVEATGTATCPEVHSPDCGVCRYLSTGGEIPAMSGIALCDARAAMSVSARGAGGAFAHVLLPHGRAPPTV